MTYKGHFKNGVIVLDEPTPLIDGEVVRVETDDANIASIKPGVPLAVRLANVIGKAQDRPADWAENHDKYLREKQRNSATPPITPIATFELPKTTALLWQRARLQSRPAARLNQYCCSTNPDQGFGALGSTV